MNWISVADAANQLEVSDRQVRRLAEVGDLVARRVGSSWLISRDSVRDRSRSPIAAGRPVSSKLAWAVLASVDAAIAGAGADEALDVGAAQLAQPGDRRRLRKLLAGAPNPAAWDSWLRRRAEPRRVWVHPGVLAKLRADPRVHAGGSAATIGSGGAIGSANKLYVAERDLAGLRSDYRVRDDHDGQVVIAVVPDDIDAPFGEPGQPVPAAVGFVDCVESRDARERHLATTQLADAMGVFAGNGA